MSMRYTTLLGSFLYGMRESFVSLGYCWGLFSIMDPGYLLVNLFWLCMVVYAGMKFYIDANVALREKVHIASVAIDRCRMDRVDVEREIHNTFRKWGFEGDLLNKIVDSIVADSNVLTDFLIYREHGRLHKEHSPLLRLLCMFIGVIIAWSSVNLGLLFFNMLFVPIVIGMAGCLLFESQLCWHCAGIKVVDILVTLGMCCSLGYLVIVGYDVF